MQSFAGGIKPLHLAWGLEILMKQERLNARRNRQSSIKDKTSMKTLNKRLIIKRKKLNDMYWDKLQDKINEDANQEA